jgi:hypothetical protein
MKTAVAAKVKTEEKKTAQTGPASQKAAPEPLTGLGGASGLPLFLSGQPLRTKLRVGQPGDPYEQEADRVATAVTHPNGSTPPTTLSATPANAIHRCACGGTCFSCQQEKRLQLKSNGAAPSHSTPAIENHLAASHGTGHPLPSPIRADLEQRLGANFDHVRIHTDSGAVQLNRALGAHAFTHGRHIYFGQNRFEPGSRNGRYLLAHELTHVIQQGGGGQIHPLQVSAAPDLDVQPLVSWSDLKSAAGATASWASDTGGSAAAWVGEKAEGAVEWGAEQIRDLIARVAPELAKLIREGPMGLVGAALRDGIKEWVASIIGDSDILRAVGQLGESLGEVFANLDGIMEGSEAACTAVANVVEALRNLGTAVAENPAIQAIKAAWDSARDALQQVSKLILVPVFDTLMEVAGTAFSAVKKLAGTIWEWGGSVRRALSRAWDWAMEQLGIGGEGEGGIWAWLKETAAEAWDSIKETFSPIIEPMKKVVTVLVAISPVGPLLFAITYGPQLVQAVQWLWQNRDNPDIVRSAHEQMGNTILPQILETVQGFSQSIQESAASFVDNLTQASESLLELAGAITGIPLLEMAQNLVSKVSSGIQNLVEWGRSTFQKAAGKVRSLIDKVRETLAPYAEVLSSLAMAILNPGMIPVIVAGWAWRAVPDCYKAPIINFLLDIVIDFLEATPNLAMFGLLWPMLKAGVIGFLRGLRAQDNATKVKISNKMAKIISGASPAFIFGFAKGLLKGLWEGLTDPFVLIYTAIEGLANLVAWLNSMANQALNPPVETAVAAAGGEGSETAVPEVDTASLGQRMQEMGQELEPPVTEVKEGFLPAVQDAFSGGEGLSFEQLMAKLGEAWEAIEGAIQGAAQGLASKVAEFLMQDSAEGEMGEGVGWLAGMITFEVILAILTAGSWTAASGAMKVLKLFAKILDWTSEALGLAFRALRRVGGFIIDGLKGLRKLLQNAGGAARRVLDALGDIGRKLMQFAEELLGFTRRGAAGAAETATGRAAREATETGAARTAREASEATAGKGTREATATVAEQSGRRQTRREATEQTGRRSDEAAKAAEMPRALAEARGIVEVNDRIDTPPPLLLPMLRPLQRRYRWIRDFGYEPDGPPGRYTIYLIASKNKIKQGYTTETVDEYLARGGKITQLPPGPRPREALTGVHVQDIGETRKILGEGPEVAGINVSTPARTGMTRRPQHHVMPQEHRKWFEERGFTGDINIDRFTVPLDVGHHQAIHGGGNWRMGRTWPDEWNTRIMRELRAAEVALPPGQKLSVREIWTITDRLMRTYGLPRNFIPYK